MAGRARPRRRQRRDSRPVVGLVRSLASQRLSSSIASDTSSWVRPRRCRSTSAAEAWPKAQAWTCCDSRSTRRSSSSSTVTADPAAAGRRAQLRTPILAVERMRLAERCRQPQDFGRVKRLVHSRRHVVPPGPSSKMMPSALSSSRMRSAAAKSRFFLASARSAMRARSPLDVAHPPWNQLGRRAARSRPIKLRARLQRCRLRAPTAATAPAAC